MGFVLPDKAEGTAERHDVLHKNATRMNEWHKSPAQIIFEPAFQNSKIDVPRLVPL
jgi:hypothetical protein